MNASQASRAAAYQSLLATNGESVSYGSSSLTAIIDRNVTKVRDGVSARDGQLDFELMGLTEIEMLVTSIAQPKSGNNFVDGLGLRHRIRYVTQTDITWVCYCTPSAT